MESNRHSYKRILDTVGIVTFIKYFNHFKNELGNQDLIELFLNNDERWKSTACATKATNGKRIFRLGLEIDALTYIATEANPNKIGVDIKEKAEQLFAEYSNLNLEEIFKEIDNSAGFADLSESDKFVLIKYRIGQSIFRRKLFEHWNGCSVSGCSNLSILIASHIKQYSECSNIERYDKYNGLLLTPNYDKLFDEYLISFEDNGQILISEMLSDEDLNKLGVSKNDCIIQSKLKLEHKNYLAEHRRKFYDYN